MPAQWIRVGIGAFGDSVKGKVTDGYNVVGVRGSDAASAESRTVVSKITCISLRSQREISMVTEQRLGEQALKASD